MAKYLITGGAGFLGINMARYLLKHKQEVVSLDIAPFDYPERAQITEITGDIRNRADADVSSALRAKVHTDDSRKDRAGDCV